MNTLSISLNRSWMLVGWVTVFLVGTDLFVVSPFLPAIGKDLGYAPADLTTMVSIFSIAYAVACPIQGRIAERVGLQKVLLFGVSLIGLANLYTALSHSMLNLLLSRMLAGWAAASVSPIIYALTAECTEPARRASRLALISSGLVIALIFGAPVGLLLGAHSGWRTVFSLLGLAFLLMVPVNSLTWRSGARPQRPAGNDEHLSGALVLMACMALWAGSTYASYTLLPVALNNEYGLPVNGVAEVLACFGLGAAIGGVLGGRLADRIGAAVMVRLSFWLMTVTYAALFFVYHMHVVWALALNMFVVSMCSYGFFPALQTCAANRFAARRPTVLGLLSSSLYVGITLGSFFGGKVFAHQGMPYVLVLSAAMALSGGLASAYICGKR
jgi:predicted MFS family arabinose efflux permease